MTGREGLRRGVHAGLGVGAYVLPLVPWEVAAGVLAAATLANCLFLGRLPGARLLLREDGSGLRGLVLYPAVLLLLLLALHEHMEVVQAAWLALALGDGLAPVIGTRLRRPTWPWNPVKSIPASCVAFACAFGAMLPVLSPASAAAASLGGLAGETLPRPFDDNLMIPLLAAGAALAVPAS